MGYSDAWERVLKIQEVILKALSGEIHWFQAAEILGLSVRTMQVVGRIQGGFGGARLRSSLLRHLRKRGARSRPAGAPCALALQACGAPLSFQLVSRSGRWEGRAGRPRSPRARARRAELPGGVELRHEGACRLVASDRRRTRLRRLQRRSPLRLEERAACRGIRRRVADQRVAGDRRRPPRDRYGRRTAFLLRRTGLGPAAGSRTLSRLPAEREKAASRIVSMIFPASK